LTLRALHLLSCTERVPISQFLTYQAEWLGVHILYCRLPGCVGVITHAAAPNLFAETQEEVGFSVWAFELGVGDVALAPFGNCELIEGDWNGRGSRGAGGWWGGRGRNRLGASHTKGLLKRNVVCFGLWLTCAAQDFSHFLNSR
jgi:hypothetical protein